MNVASHPVRFRLGAEELLELGGSNQVILKERRPFLSGRNKIGQRSGSSYADVLDVLGSVSGFLATSLSLAFNTLSDVVNVPLGILAQGVDIAFNAVAHLISNIPTLGDLLAQILVLGGSLIKFGLSIPGLSLHGLGNILGGIGKAFGSERSVAESDQKLDEAKNRIISKAPQALMENVKLILDASGISGKTPTLGVGADGTPVAPPAGTAIPFSGVLPPAGVTDFRKVLAVGIPVAGAIALILVLA